MSGNPKSPHSTAHDPSGNKQSPLPAYQKPPEGQTQSEIEKQSESDEQTTCGRSFLVAAIRNWPSLRRALCLVSFIAATLLGSSWLLIGKFLPPVVEKIDMAEGHLMLTLKDGRQATTVSVPAYQLAVPTSVKLDKHSQINISADGLVLTIGGLLNAPTNITMLTNEIGRRALMSSLDRDSNPAWRLPDGSLYYGKTVYNPSQNSSDTKDLLIMRDADYGCLLAFAVDPKIAYPEGVLDVMASNGTNFFKIGRQGIIRFNASTGKFQLGDDPSTGCSFKQGDLIYLTINDSLVRSVSEIKLSEADERDLKTNTNAKALADLELKRQFLEAQKDICIHTLNRPFGIWYLDNRGSFTATLEKTPE
jgi:hypothetical protein